MSLDYDPLRRLEEKHERLLSNATCTETIRGTRGLVTDPYRIDLVGGMRTCTTNYHVNDAHRGPIDPLITSDFALSAEGVAYMLRKLGKEQETYMKVQLVMLNHIISNTIPNTSLPHR
jgi:hypothetical protein